MAAFLALNHQLFSPGPVTRQYAAISGNKRTKVQFLAAYCRLSVRILPLILRLVRVCSLRAPLQRRSATAGPEPHAPSLAPVLICQGTCPGVPRMREHRLKRHPYMRMAFQLSRGTLLPTVTNARTIRQTARVVKRTPRKSAPAMTHSFKIDVPFSTALTCIE